MDRPRILLLGKLPPPYLGPAVATQILLRSALRERYELIHLDTKTHASLDTLGTWQLSSVTKNLRLYVRYVELLRKHRPDLVLVPISQSAWGFAKDSAFILLSRLFGRPTLLQLRGSNLQNWLRSAPRPVRAYVEGVIRTAQGAIVLGKGLRYLFSDYFGDEQIFVVPNGADYQIPARQAKGEQVRVLYLANLQSSKGIEDVIGGIEVLRARGVTGFTLDVVGKWRDERTKQRCLQRVEAQQLPVVFHGPAYDAAKLAFMAQADVFVFTPREPEGHPWVIIEALAAGLPIVATDQGTITESVQEGVNGFIVKTHSPDAIADRLERLIQQPQLRAAFSAASRQHYQAHFTEERMVAQMSAAFDALLQQQASAHKQAAHAPA